MRHQGQSQPERKSRRTALRKLATVGLMGLMLFSNTGCRSGGGGGLSSRIRDCRLFNVFRRNNHQPQTVVAGDPCCNGVVSGPVVATGDPCGTPVVATADPCANGATVIQQQGAIIQTTPSTITVPSGASTAVPDLAPIESNKPTSNLDAKGANFNRPITSSPSTLQAKSGTTSNYR